MHQNIAKTLKRGAQLEDIVAQTEALENQVSNSSIFPFIIKDINLIMSEKLALDI